MMMEMPREGYAAYETLAISHRALKALGELEGEALGILSPLSAMRVPAGEAAAEELVSTWESLNGTWEWSVPALVDPHRTIAFLLGDGNLNLAGQYVFPDAEAHGPGFEVEALEDRIEINGPFTLSELKFGLFAYLSLDDVAEPEPLRLSLPADHFRALAACLDAYRAAALGRRLLRKGGVPSGVSLTEIVEAWADGNSMPDPGWLVSLLSLLDADRAPRETAKRFPRILQELSSRGYLDESKDPASGQTLYSFPSALLPILHGLTSGLGFAVTTQRLSAPATVESGLLMGWRTPWGVWLADLSDMERAGVFFALAGPAAVADILAEMLGDDTLAPPWEEFAIETPYTREAMVSRLRRQWSGKSARHSAGIPAGGESTPLSPHYCVRCGAPLRKGAAFCGNCGAAVARRNIQSRSTDAPSSGSTNPCPNCGYACSPRAKFCRKCGTRL